MNTAMSPWECVDPRPATMLDSPPTTTRDFGESDVDNDLVDSPLSQQQQQQQLSTADFVRRPTRPTECIDAGVDEASTTVESSMVSSSPPYYCCSLL
jgi:hypothetical protein